VPYHHGDLRRAILDAAVESISAHGSTALSLREVSRRAGVSHAAPIHHFGDKAGVLTALAAEGYELLAEAPRQRATISSRQGSHTSGSRPRTRPTAR
jgi:AcrR family transcriptional regulator